LAEFVFESGKLDSSHDSFSLRDNVSVQHLAAANISVRSIGISE